MNKKDTKVIVLVGIPASGKTTISNIFVGTKDCKVLSSDSIREEVFGNESSQEDNGLVFSIMNERLKENIEKNISTVYDATNLSSKRRKALLEKIPKGVKKCCILVGENAEECIRRDSNRDRVVGEEVINAMYKRLQIPMAHEGFDDIILYPLHFRHTKIEFRFPRNYDDYRKMLSDVGCGECVDMSQDTPYHTLSVSRHMYYAYDIIKNIDNDDVKIACLLHDIGKPVCKEFNNRYASFKGHEYVSAQMAINVLKQFCIPEKRIIRIATLIQLHMRMHDKKWSKKSRAKFKKEIGEDMYNDLLILNACDSTAK